MSTSIDTHFLGCAIEGLNKVAAAVSLNGGL